jgi:hypothetical protein
MNPLFLAIATLLTLAGPLNESRAQSAPARAAEGAGAKGGGQSVRDGGRKIFRDLIDETSCRWVSGSEFIKAYLTDYPAFLARVRDAHWYFADVLEREGNSMQVCIADARLRIVPAADRDSVTIYTREGDTTQAAIRFLDNPSFFVDWGEFKEYDRASRLALFLHEVGHSFLPLGATRRNESLRAMTLALSGSFDAKSLEAAIKGAGLTVPYSSYHLELYKEKLLVALHSEQPLRARLLAAQQLYPVVWGIWEADSARIRVDLERELSRFLEQLNMAFKSGHVEAVLELYRYWGGGPNDGIFYNKYWNNDCHVGPCQHDFQGGYRLAMDYGQPEIFRLMMQMAQPSGDLLAGLLARQIRIIGNRRVAEIRESDRLILDMLAQCPDLNAVLLRKDNPVVSALKGLNQDHAWRVATLLCHYANIGTYACWDKVYDTTGRLRNNLFDF